MLLKVSFKLNLLVLALLLTSALVPVAATNSDTAKERRWAEQVIDGLLDGDDVWLIDDSGHEFLGILTEGDRSSGHAVVLLHGVGVHPNWPDVIYPLRAGLLERHITTLSLQMPILEKFPGVSMRRWITSTMRATGISRWLGIAWGLRWPFTISRTVIPTR